MAFTQSLNPNVLEKHNRVLFLPSSWNRLISLIKYQVPNGGFAVMEGEFGAGKSAFAKIFEKKVVLDDKIDCQIIQVHPLSTIQQIRAQLPKAPEKPLIVIIDDAHEASTLLLQRLTQPEDDIYWLLLAEPGIGDRVDAFAERKVELPLFTKEDCFEFLQKQLQDQPKYAQVSQMQSDTIWYSSQGLPKDIIKHAKQNLNKLFSGQESSENFEKANKSWYMTAALSVATLILIIVFIINIFSEDGVEKEAEVAHQELVISDLEELKQKETTETTEKGFIANKAMKENKAAKVASSQDELDTQNQDSEQAVKQNNDALKSTELEGSHSSQKAEPLVSPSLSKEDVAKASDSADPIETIALQVAKKESTIGHERLREDEEFSSWLSKHSQDSYSLQLFSHSDKAAAERFQQSLDLADSYVYPAEIDNNIRYRVLWGAFKTRAEATQAIESLPTDILAQKPWIRQFSAISHEVSQ